MPVNHAKEFLKSVHNEALFSHLFSRTLIEVRSVNFKAKFLKMAKINSEFLNVSMVEPAPESATTLVSLLYRLRNYHKITTKVQTLPKGLRTLKVIIPTFRSLYAWSFFPHFSGKVGRFLRNIRCTQFYFWQCRQ